MSGERKRERKRKIEIKREKEMTYRVTDQVV